MKIQCECGAFGARLKAFPKATPGRLVCYCDDCQSYLHHLKRADLLDANGGTEVIPAYPADVEIVSGREHLKCARLSPNGTLRFYAACCSTPIVNTAAKRAWAGFFRGVYTADGVEKTLGPVRSRIMGRFAKGTPPAGTPQTFDFKALRTVLPFMLKGKLSGKSKPSPFLAEDGVTPIVTPQVLSKAERQAARTAAGV